jgi:hypothetical protein
MFIRAIFRVKATDYLLHTFPTAGCAYPPFSATAIKY